MWELYHKEDWALKNLWFWTVVLEKTLENPLDCQEIKPVNLKGNQPWIFIGSSSTLATWCEEQTHWKRPWWWERLKAGGEGDDRGWDGWMASPTRWTRVFFFFFIFKLVMIWVQSLSHVQLFATPWSAACQASLSITNSQSLLKLMSIQSVMPSKCLILCLPFSSRLQSFPASGSFSMSQLFASGGQGIGASASASVLPMNIQDWCPLGCTGWISLQSKEPSRVFFNTTVQKHQFFRAQLSLQSSSHIHTWAREKPGSPAWPLILCVTLTGPEDQLIGLTPIEMFPWR